jgi:hypothetical protein
VVHFISWRGKEGIILNCSQGNSSHLLKRTLFEENPESLKSLLGFQEQVSSLTVKVTKLEKAQVASLGAGGSIRYSGLMKIPIFLL